MKMVMVGNDFNRQRTMGAASCGPRPTSLDFENEKENYVVEHRHMP